MGKLKNFVVKNANKINIGVGIAVILGFTVLCIELVKLDKEIG